jgi:tetratricopeptide (TPR) repeat protein
MGEDVLGTTLVSSSSEDVSRGASGAFIVRDTDPWIAVDAMVSRRDVAAARAAAASRKGSDRAALVAYVERMAALQPSPQRVANVAAKPAPAAPTVSEVLALVEKAGVERRLGRAAASAASYAAAGDAAERLGWTERAASARASAASVAHAAGDETSAVANAERRVALEETRGNARAAGEALAVLGRLRLEAGEPKKAAEALEACVMKLAVAGDRRAEGAAFVSLSAAYVSMGRLPEALDRAERALARYEAAEDRHGIATANAGLGTVHRRLGRYSRAASRLEQARDTFDQLGDGERSARASAERSPRPGGRRRGASPPRGRGRDPDPEIPRCARDDKGGAVLGVGGRVAARETQEPRVVLQRGEGRILGEAGAAEVALLHDEPLERRERRLLLPEREVLGGDPVRRVEALVRQAQPLQLQHPFVGGDRFAVLALLAQREGQPPPARADEVRGAVERVLAHQLAQQRLRLAPLLLADQLRRLLAAAVVIERIGRGGQPGERVVLGRRFGGPGGPRGRAERGEREGGEHASMISASTMVFFLRSNDWLHLPPIELHCQSDQGRL